MILISKRIIPKQFLGLTLWPFVILKRDDLKDDEVLVNHENIHLRQQLELLVLPFYFWYSLEYLIRLIQYRDAYKAYRNISFEREAYAMEYDLAYTKKRPIWSFMKYLLH
ncbi:MAG: hypothetical protein HRT68_03785 [Flavobacteriaceae bacterium]|nr:hypothetical protein [Flavobacteriaceae bacterium]